MFAAVWDQPHRPPRHPGRSRATAAATAWWPSPARLAGSVPARRSRAPPARSGPPEAAWANSSAGLSISFRRAVIRSSSCMLTPARTLPAYRPVTDRRRGTATGVAEPEEAPTNESDDLHRGHGPTTSTSNLPTPHTRHVTNNFTMRSAHWPAGRRNQAHEIAKGRAESSHSTYAAAATQQI